MSFVFVDLPEDYERVYLYDRGDDDGDDPVRQVLWGDFLWLAENATFDASAEWTHVVWCKFAPEKRCDLQIRTEHVRVGRPLEIIFVDVGQGDGCVLITPERDERERIVVIDAGKTEDMGNFLEGRFNAYTDGFEFHAAVITHPDLDHYFGFKRIFDNDQITFDRVYHSGLVERPVSGSWAKLGGKRRRAGDRHEYLEDLCDSDAKFRALFADESTFGRKRYPATVEGALKSGRVGAFEMLAKDTSVGERSWMPEFSPDDDRGYTIEVLGPVVETHGDSGTRRLQCFPNRPRNKDGSPRISSSFSHTKNGHSVLLKLQYGGFRVLFGGDLNRSAEEYLLTHYAGFDEWPHERAEKEEMVVLASDHFRSEIMKACHHGSADVTDEFLEAVNPAAFVISSGDEENYVHPRPDLLGRLGKKGRGTAPVLLSTELQRSWRQEEAEEQVSAIKRQVRDLHRQPDDHLRDALLAAIEDLGGSNVAVDGAIYVKTDGHRLIAAFKKESRSETDRWFYYEYRIVNDRLILVPRGGH
ncbi:MAG: hypothetical protein AAF941_07960 [Pseudomonadota bacterium]